MATYTVTALFTDGEQALLAAERARELVGSRASVRVLVRGQEGSVIETSVLADVSDTPKAILAGFALGLVAMAVVLLLGVSWGFAIFTLLWGVGSGVLLAMWLTGEVYRARVLRPAVRGP